MTQGDAGPKIYFSDFLGLEPEVLEESAHLTSR